MAAMSPIIREATDTLRELQAENERLREQLQDLKHAASFLLWMKESYGSKVLLADEAWAALREAITKGSEVPP